MPEADPILNKRNDRVKWYALRVRNIWTWSDWTQKANEQVDFTWKWHFPLEVQPKFYWHYLAICPYSFSTHLLSICCLSEIIRVCSFENVMCSIWRKFLKNYGKNINGRKLEQSQCYHWNMVACESRSQDTNSLFFLETGKVGSI